MIDFLNLLFRQQIACLSQCQSKKKVFETLSRLLANQHPELDADSIMQVLVSRERLGSTAVGKGIVFPHARMLGIDKATGALLILKESLDFDTTDNQVSDLFFALLVPEEATEAHLQLLAGLAHCFQHAEICELLRNANSSQQAYQILIDTQQKHSE